MWLSKRDCAALQPKPLDIHPGSLRAVWCHGHLSSSSPISLVFGELAMTRPDQTALRREERKKERKIESTVPQPNPSIRNLNRKYLSLTDSGLIGNVGLPDPSGEVVGHTKYKYLPG